MHKTTKSLFLFAGFLLAALSLNAAQAVVAWDDNSSSETGFEVQRADGNTSSDAAFFTIITTFANTTTWLDTHVTVGAVYSYRVRARRGDDASAWSNIATTIGVLLAPTNTTPNAANITTISIRPGDSYTVKGSTNKTLQGAKTINVAPGKQANFVAAP